MEHERTLGTANGFEIKQEYLVMTDSPLLENLSLSPPAKRKPSSTFAPQDQVGGLGQENIEQCQVSEPSWNIETATSSPNQSPVLRSQPILIPSTPFHRRDPDRVLTPLSGRGDRKGHYLPLSRTPSPKGRQSCDDILEDITNSPQRLRRSSSSSSRLQRSQLNFGVHTDLMAARYTPTSPLSPRLPVTGPTLSPQPSRPRAHHSSKNARGLNMNLPRYHPANFPQGDSVTPTGQFQSPPIVLNGAPYPAVVETPKLMRERQRELIERAKLLSKIAASPMGVKPEAPRLDPLGSPKGPMTPLALEDGAADYFAVPMKMRSSPGNSPGQRSDSSGGSNDERKSKSSRAAKGMTNPAR